MTDERTMARAEYLAKLRAVADQAGIFERGDTSVEYVAAYYLGRARARRWLPRSPCNWKLYEEINHVAALMRRQEWGSE